MTKQIRLNAFAMNCVAHQSPGLWTHPRDRTAEYNRLPYWLDLAKALERGRFDGLFREHQGQNGSSLWDVHVDDLIPSRNYRRVHYGEA